VNVEAFSSSVGAVSNFAIFASTEVAEEEGESTRHEDGGGARPLADIVPATPELRMSVVRTYGA
jgi:hypothetical protein